MYFSYRRIILKNFGEVKKVGFLKIFTLQSGLKMCNLHQIYKKNYTLKIFSPFWENVSYRRFSNLFISSKLFAETTPSLRTIFSGTILH